MAETTFEGWAILELMGHRKLAGYLSEHEIAGKGFIRIDVPTEPPATQLYSPAAVYAITPTTEEVARRWELPADTRGAVNAEFDEGDDFGDPDDDPDF